MISPEIAGFWGGYDVAFKLIGSKEYEKCAGDINAMRRNALKIGGKGKFEIDISKFEFCKPKKADSMDTATESSSIRPKCSSWKSCGRFASKCPSMGRW